MNRRQALKRVAGLGVGVTLAPVVAKAVGHTAKASFVNAVPCGASNCAPPACAPSTPPEDSRTPEQVFEDYVENLATSILNDLNAKRHKSYKATYLVPDNVFQRIQEKLGDTADLRTIAGQKCLIVNGSIITKGWG